MTEVKLTVNGVARSDEVEPRLLLVHYLRETLGLRAANVGCDTTSCGACTVLLDGESVKSCTVLAVQVRRLSRSAATDESEPTRARKWLHRMRVSIAASGSRTNSAPSAAGRNSQAGSPT